MNEMEQYVMRVHDKLRSFNASRKILVEKESRVSLFFNNVRNVFRSVLDVFRLVIKLKSGEIYNVIYIGDGLCIKIDGQYRDRLTENIITGNIIYINRGKDTQIRFINRHKVYNIGGIVKILMLINRVNFKDNVLRVFYAYKKINDFILGFAKMPVVYSLCYYNRNGLSLVFSKHRSKIKLIEVQHGGIVNFPVYSEPSDIKVADAFYVKNQKTIDYLQEYLCKNFPETEYHLLTYPQVNTQFKAGIHILYASTIEFNGIHPLFMEYLSSIKRADNLTVYIRLHPRERYKRVDFEKQLKGIVADVVFDESKNWLESNKVTNLIVVSPWSSVIEDAADNGYKTIVVDDVGRKRFEYLIDNDQVYFAATLKDFKVAVSEILS